MEVAVDISLYPIKDDFIPFIDDVIARIKSHAAITVKTNAMSTQIRGEYDDVMKVLSEEMKMTFKALPKAVFAIKILNNPHDG